MLSEVTVSNNVHMSTIYSSKIIQIMQGMILGINNELIKAIHFKLWL